MMNIHSRYHATLKTKSTCHILLIYWHMMSGLIISAADLAWVEAMKQQAKKIHDARFWWGWWMMDEFGKVPSWLGHQTTCLSISIYIYIYIVVQTHMHAYIYIFKWFQLYFLGFMFEVHQLYTRPAPNLDGLQKESAWVWMWLMQSTPNFFFGQCWAIFLQMFDCGIDPDFSHLTFWSQLCIVDGFDQDGAWKLVACFGTTFLQPLTEEKEVNNFSAKLQRLSKTNRSTQILVENMEPWLKILKPSYTCHLN